MCNDGGTVCVYPCAIKHFVPQIKVSDFRFQLKLFPQSTKRIEFKDCFNKDQSRKQEHW